MSLIDVDTVVSSLLTMTTVVLTWPDRVSVVVLSSTDGLDDKVLSSRLIIVVSSLSEMVAVMLRLTETNGVLGLNVMEAVNGGTGTTDTVLLTRTVTTTEDGMSVLENPDAEGLGTKTEVVAASLLGMRPDAILSLSDTAVGADREVLLLSLSGKSGRVVDLSLSLSLSGIETEDDVASLSVKAEVPGMLGMPVEMEVRLERSTSLPSIANQC